MNNNNKLTILLKLLSEPILLKTNWCFPFLKSDFCFTAKNYFNEKPCNIHQWDLKVGLQSMRGSDAFLLRSSQSLRSGWLLLRLLCWIILAVPTLLTRQTLRSHLKSHKVTCWTDSSGGRSGGHCFCIQPFCLSIRKLPGGRYKLPTQVPVLFGPFRINCVQQGCLLWQSVERSPS